MATSALDTTDSTTMREFIQRWTSAPLDEPACCLCGSTERRPLLEERFGGHTFGIVECRQCGLAYSCPRPTEEMRKWLHTPELRNALVDAGLIAERHRIRPDRPAVFARDSQEPSLANYRRGLALLAAEMKPGRLLDVGCAGGRFVEMAREAGWEAIGCDVAPQALAQGREELGLDLRHGRIEDFGFPEGHFDAVTLWNVIEHVSDPCSTLREGHRILAPGGKLLVETPNFAVRRILCRVGLPGDPDRYCRDSFEHLYHFTPRTMRAALRQAGFHGVALYTINDDGSLRAKARLRRAAARALAALTAHRINLHTPLLAIGATSAR